jgi:hypothetical protein
MIIKKKLSLGLGFLFFIIFILAIFCSYYILENYLRRPAIF